MKALYFYGRFLPSFTGIGYVARGLPLRAVNADFGGQTWLVTGASGGIGRAIALGAAARGARVLAVARREEALAELAREGGADIVPVQRDLSLVADNLSLAEEAPRIDVLVNNVGMLETRHRATAEGVGRMYATNLLAPYALTRHLIAAGKLDGGAIVNVASGGLYNAPLNMPGLDAPEKNFNGFVAYATHKRAQIVLSDAWTGAAPGLVAYTMHPGWVRTEGVRSALPWMDRRIGALLRTTAQGGDTVLWLAARRPEPVPGALWFDRKPRTAHAYARTRQTLASPDEVIARLEGDLAKVAP